MKEKTSVPKTGPLPASSMPIMQGFAVHLGRGGAGEDILPLPPKLPPIPTRGTEEATQGSGAATRSEDDKEP